MPAMLDLIPLHIMFVERTELYTFKKSIEANGLFCSIVESLPIELKIIFLIHHHDLMKVPVVIGERSTVVKFESDLADIDACLDHLNFPVKYHKASLAYHTHNLTDPNWGMLLDAQHIISDSTESCQTLLNPYWKQVGIYFFTDISART